MNTWALVDVGDGYAFWWATLWKGSAALWSRTGFCRKELPKNKENDGQKNRSVKKCDKLMEYRGRGNDRNRMPRIKVDEISEVLEAGAWLSRLASMCPSGVPSGEGRLELARNLAEIVRRWAGNGAVSNSSSLGGLGSSQS